MLVLILGDKMMGDFYFLLELPSEVFTVAVY